METVSYKSVLDLVAQLAFGDPDLHVDDEQSLRTFINLRASEWWRHFPWPQICPVERRQLRPSWNASTTYAAGTSSAAVEVYFAKADRFYQSLKTGNTGNVPASQSGSDWIVNSAWWAECEPSYEGDDYVDSVTYAKGEVRRLIDDGRYYACHTAHVAGVSFDATKWGILTDFVRSIPRVMTGTNTIGDVIKVYETDPRQDLDAEMIPIREYTDGWIVFTDLNRVWVKYRKPVPSWTGAPYDSTVSWASGSKVYYLGDWWEATATAGIGIAPPAAPWQIIAFPLWLQSIVANHAYSDWLKKDGQTDKYPRFAKEAQLAFNREVAIQRSLQGGMSTLNVRTS